MSEADDLARRVADTMRSREGTGPAFGIEIEEVREGYARIRMEVRADMVNGHAITNGGMIFLQFAERKHCRAKCDDFISGGVEARRRAGGGGAGTLAGGPQRRLSDQRPASGRQRNR